MHGWDDGELKDGPWHRSFSCNEKPDGETLDDVPDKRTEEVLAYERDMIDYAREALTPRLRRVVVPKAGPK